MCALKGAVKQGRQNPIVQKQEQWKFLKSLAPPLMAAAVLALSPICITPGNQPHTCVLHPPIHTLIPPQLPALNRKRTYLYFTLLH